MNQKKLSKIMNAIFWVGWTSIMISIWIPDKIVAGSVLCFGMVLCSVWIVLSQLWLKRSRKELNKMLEDWKKEPEYFECREPTEAERIESVQLRIEILERKKVMLINEAQQKLNRL